MNQSVRLQKLTITFHKVCGLSLIHIYQAMAFLQPIVIDSHVLNNPWLNYSVYLSNTIIPGILMLLIFRTTVYTIGSEMKTNTQKEWMDMADNAITVALTGKLLPQTVVFVVMEMCIRDRYYALCRLLYSR